MKNGHWTQLLRFIFARFCLLLSEYYKLYAGLVFAPRQPLPRSELDRSFIAHCNLTKALMQDNEWTSCSFNVVISAQEQPPRLMLLACRTG